MNVIPDIATIDALMRAPARAALLWALADGQSLPASELAYRAYVSPQTASAHLARLVDGGLLRVEQCGRHRYYGMANAEVVQAVEQLIALAPPVKLRARKDQAEVDPLRAARTCYGHLAGRLGVAVTEALVQKGLIRLDEQAYQVTGPGEAWFADFGIDLVSLRKQRRAFAHRCIDWSERVPHMGGALGDTVTTRLFQLDWVRRSQRRRAVQVTESGRQALKKFLDLSF